MKMRRMRHWKQRFEANAKFVWNKPVTWQGEQVELGAPIPEELSKNRNRLRRFWEAGVIQLCEFEAPDVATGQVADKADDDGVDEDGVKPAGHPVHPDEDGEALRSETDETVDAEIAEVNGDEDFGEELDAEDEDASEEVSADDADEAEDEAAEEPEAEDEEAEDASEDEAEEEKELVVKVGSRKWAIVGQEDGETFSTKKAALEAAEAQGEDDWLED